MYGRHREETKDVEKKGYITNSIEQETRSWYNRVYFLESLTQFQPLDRLGNTFSTALSITTQSQLNTSMTYGGSLVFTLNPSLQPFNLVLMHHLFLKKRRFDLLTTLSPLYKHHKGIQLDMKAQLLRKNAEIYFG